MPQASKELPSALNNADDGQDEAGNTYGIGHSDQGYKSWAVDSYNVWLDGLCWRGLCLPLYSPHLDYVWMLMSLSRLCHHIFAAFLVPVER